MATKIYGVGIEDIQKLRDFYRSLMKKKFVRPFDKMEFLDFVQVKSETVIIPQIVRVAVAASNIHIDDGFVVISKSRILKIDNDHDVTVNLKRPYFGCGTFICLKFNSDAKKQEFLDALGEIDEYASDDDSMNSDQSPPSSESSNDNSMNNSDQTPPSTESSSDHSMNNSDQTFPSSESNNDENEGNLA